MDLEAALKNINSLGCPEALSRLFHIAYSYLFENIFSKRIHKTTHCETVQILGG